VALLLEFNQSLKVTILVHKNHVKNKLWKYFVEFLARHS